MTTPIAPSKRYYAAGTKRGTTWGTAVALGANQGVLITGDSGLKRNQKFDPYPAIDQIIPQDGILGPSDAVDLTPPVNLQYEMGPVGSWIAALYGTAGAPANGGEANVYLHTFTWANSVEKFFTYAEERPGHIWEVPSAMPYKASIKPSGAQIAAGIALRGNTMKDDSAINGANQMDVISYVNRTKFLNFTEGQFLMADQSSGALTANNDSVEISDFEVSLERSIDSVHIAGGINIAQPVEGDIPNCTLKVTLPRASNNNVDYFSSWEDMTAKKAKLTFTGPTAGNNSTYRVSFYFPRLMLNTPPDVKLEGVIKNELTFSVLEAASTPTGMNSTRPYMEVVNTAANDYLS